MGRETQGLSWLMNCVWHVEVRISETLHDHSAPAFTRHPFPRSITQSHTHTRTHGKTHSVLILVFHSFLHPLSVCVETYSRFRICFWRRKHQVEENVMTEQWVKHHRCDHTHTCTELRKPFMKTRSWRQSFINITEDPMKASMGLLWRGQC